ncbi:ATP-binding protein [Planobispora longispora]|uniref:ATP-binding protein n=1 Tax=Planobispora longispora TaxID=28887 RepID=UPI001944619E|nr:ATP-binding protein [Planobispora longispora]
MRGSQWLGTLHATGLLGAPETPSLDRLVRLAARLLDAAVVSVSLIDHDHWLLISAAGRAGRPVLRRQDFPPSPLCQHLVTTGVPLIIADARGDRRWKGDPAAQAVDREAEVTAYAAFPLRTADGEMLGAMSVIDTAAGAPGGWDRERTETAEGFAAAAESQATLWLAHAEALLAGARLQMILERTPYAFVSIDATGTVTAWNAAAERLFGWSSEEAVGQDVADLIIPPSLRQAHYEGLRRVRESGRSILAGQRLELTAVDRKGREFPIEMVLQVNTEHGESVFHAFLNDISMRRRAETLREAQHAVARVLADAASTAQAAVGTVTAVTGALGWACGEYWRVEPDETGITRVCSWTRPGLDLSGFTGDQPVSLPPGQGLPGLVWVTGRDAWIRDLPTDPKNFTRRHSALQAGLHTAIGLPVHSGRQVVGVLTFFAETVEEPDEDLVATLDGISAHLGRYKERRRAEELTLALTASRRHLDRVIGQLSDFVWTIEVTAEHRILPVYTSPDSTGVFGGAIPRGADILQLIGEHIHPDDIPAFETYRATLAAGEPAEVEFRITGADGIVRWIWTRAMPRREDERLFIDGISTNVTERHQLLEERERLLAQEQEQVRRLRELDRMKDELVAMVSHELRSPIGAIRGYAEMLLDEPGLPDEHRMFVDVIDRKSAHLQRLVDDLLDLARFDAGHINLDSRPMSLSELACQAADDHRPSAEAKNLVLDTDLVAGVTLRADPVRLRQVLDNLLSNAIRYTPPGGTVFLTVGCDDEAVVTVADTGIGVPAEQYPQLFDRFFRASTALASGVKGTGLGLAITRAIVEAHGGTVTAQPREGGGTVFTVRLPAASPEET